MKRGKTLKLKKKKIDNRKYTYLKGRKMPSKTKVGGIPIPKGWDIGKGRIKGTKNKFTTLKRAFIEAFEKLGGTDGMVTWAEMDSKHRASFYNMVARMLPREVNIGTVDEVNPANLENLTDKELDSIIAGVVKARGTKKGVKNGKKRNT